MNTDQNSSNNNSSVRPQTESSRASRELAGSDRVNRSLPPETIARLIHTALDARRFSYAPYSHYCVGAAVLTEDGTVFNGCNIENASYGATICAERTAIFAAVRKGHRRLIALALAAAPEGVEPAAIKDYPSPCGICRQVMREFADPSGFKVILAKSPEDYRILTLTELLPESFGPSFLQEQADTGAEQ